MAVVRIVPGPHGHLELVAGRLDGRPHLEGVGEDVLLLEVVHQGVEQRRDVGGAWVLALEPAGQQVPEGAVHVLAVQLVGRLAEVLVADADEGADDLLHVLARESVQLGGVLAVEERRDGEGDLLARHGVTSGADTGGSGLSSRGSRSTV